MGQKISQIAYNEEFEDLQTKGLSKTQVSLIKEHFYALCEGVNRQDKTMNASMLSNLIKIPKQEAKLVIEFADIDGDGKLNDYDFVCLVGLFTKANLQDKLEGIFYLFDEDYSQLISDKELEKLVRCVLCINENTTEISQNQVKQKMKEILEGLFTEDNELKISEFVTLAKEDQEFQIAFKKLGIFQEQDLELGYDEDLEEEFNKGEDEFRDENYENIKNGLEIKKEGIFETQQNQADEFMAVKPFLGTVKNSVPSNFDNSQINLNEPNANLNLEFVHGYRCFDTRNNIYYINSDNILFHSAAVGITMNINNRNQNFNFGNSDDIISIAKYQDIVATGQIGHKPVINLWSCSTQESLAIIVGDLQKGIAHLTISHDGQLLAGVAMNDEHDIAIYDISNVRQPVLLIKQKGVRDVVLDLKFSKDSQQLILATKKELYFAKFTPQKIRISKATGWSKQKPMSLSIAFMQKSDCVVGLNNGKIAVVKGNSISKQITAHKKCIYAMKNNQDQTKLFTGGADGKVLVFDQNFQILQEIIINNNNFKSINPKVRAIDFCEEDKKLLIGTRGGEIIEHYLQNQQSQFVLQGHFSKELWGLAVHPFQQEFVTVGEDFLLAKWNVKSRQNLLSKKLKYEANTISVSPQGTQVAIGCKNGYLLILNYSNFQLLKNKRVSQKELTQVKYSQCGKYIAVGARDSKIYIFETSQKFKRISICKGHHSTITHLDFSEDSQTLQSNCTSYELLYWNVKNGKQDTRGASNNRDEKWATWTCVLGWPVQGIFPPCSDGTDVNSVDRTKSNNIVATGDDFGNVKLFKFPNFKNSSYVKFTGHSSHVTNVRFSNDQNYLISVGGNDKSIFQWKFKDYDNEQEEEEDYEQDQDEEDYLNLPEEDQNQQQNQLGMFELEEEDAVEFMATKPWVGDLQNSIPSDFQYTKGMEDAPQETLDLHYINGYRCFDTRYSARITDDNNVVFISAALGVKMNHQQNTQTFFKEHEEDLVSFDLHCDRQIAASGQMAMKGKSKFIDIFVWDVNTKEVLAQLNGFHLRAIQLLKFSPSGNTLYSFGKDDDNSLAVYDWKNQRLITTAKVDKKNVLDISFSSENQFITVGSKHVKSWQLNGTKINSQRIAWKGCCKPESVLCCQGISKFGFVIGTIKGKLIPVRGGMSKPLQAHQGKIYVLHYDNDMLYSGGEDGLIKQYQIKGNLKEIQTIASVNTNESFSPKIRALDICNNQMLIGTGASELFIINNYQNSQQKQKILNGHYQGELWGLACHPSSDQYVTCGDDSTIRIWSAQQRQQLKAIKLNEKLRAICYSNKGEFIACATYTGKIFLFDNQLKQLQNYQSSFNRKNQWIEEIKFSPDDQYLAYGAHGGASKLEILKLSQQKLKKYSLINAGITSALLHLDWSQDSSQIVVNSQAYELKFVDIFAKKQIRASSVKDQEWFSWTCKIGFPVQGIYPGVDGTDVNTVDRSSNKQILATGDDFQLVKLFKYPSVQPKSSFNSYKGHASHVTRVRFLQQDKYLISTGGNDKTSIIWKVQQQNQNEDSDDEDDQQEMEFVQKKLNRDKYGYEQDDDNQQEQIEQLGAFQIEHVEETEFMAVKPWLGAIKQPSNFISPEPDQNEKPNVNIELEYVYGYRSKDCRNNLYLIQDNLFYFAAALGIQLDYNNNIQQHFIQHRDDVISMCYDPNKQLFATGELGPKPWICLWSQNTMKLQCTLKEGIIKGIQAIKFSPNGNKLAAVCIDDNNTVAVFDVDKQQLIACDKGDTAKIVDLEWINDQEFYTAGLRHFKTWKVSSNSIKGSRGSFKKGSSDKLVFIKKVNNKIICGAFKGELQIWTGGQCGKSIKLGKGSVDAVAVGESGDIYVGGKQKILFIFDQSLKQKSSLNLAKFLFQSMSLQIRSIQVNKEETELYLGMYSSQIFKITSQNNDKIFEFENCQNLIVQELMTGHYARNLKWTNEIWGLYSLQNNTFLTVSDDAVLRMWDKQERKQIKYLELNIDKKGAKLEKDQKTKDLQDQAKLRSVAVSYNQKYAAVGCKEGTVRIIDINKWKQIKILKRRKRWIQTLRFSPDDTKLAVGSHDCFIDIYDVNQNFKILHKMKKHSSFLTHLDWSQDSQFLHSNCGAYELLFWDAFTGKQITRGASALRDEDWATWSCVLGWPVQGIFKAEWDGSDVNMVDRSHNEIADGYKLLACADDFSQIRIYKYPCLDKVTQGVILKGHSSHVTNVKFDQEDQYLFSTGGEDQCVMQWKIM